MGKFRRILGCFILLFNVRLLDELIFKVRPTALDVMVIGILFIIAGGEE